MIFKLENYEQKREFLIDLDYCIGYKLNMVEDTIVFITNYQQIRVVNDQPFYDNWSEFINHVREHFNQLISIQ